MSWMNVVKNRPKERLFDSFYARGINVSDMKQDLLKGITIKQARKEIPPNALEEGVSHIIDMIEGNIGGTEVFDMFLNIMTTSSMSSRLWLLTDYCEDDLGHDKLSDAMEYWDMHTILSLPLINPEKEYKKYENNLKKATNMVRDTLVKIVTELGLDKVLGTSITEWSSATLSAGKQLKQNYRFRSATSILIPAIKMLPENLHMRYVLAVFRDVFSDIGVERTNTEYDSSDRSRPSSNYMIAFNTYLSSYSLYYEATKYILNESLDLALPEQHDSLRQQFKELNATLDSGLGNRGDIWIGKIFNFKPNINVKQKLGDTKTPRSQYNRTETVRNVNAAESRKHIDLYQYVTDTIVDSMVVDSGHHEQYQLSPFSDADLEDMFFGVNTSDKSFYQNPKKENNIFEQLEEANRFVIFISDRTIHSNLMMSMKVNGFSPNNTSKMIRYKTPKAGAICIPPAVLNAIKDMKLFGDIGAVSNKTFYVNQQGTVGSDRETTEREEEVKRPTTAERQEMQAGYYPALENYLDDKDKDFMYKVEVSETRNGNALSKQFSVGLLNGETLIISYEIKIVVETINPQTNERNPSDTPSYNDVNKLIEQFGNRGDKFDNPLYIKEFLERGNNI